MWYYFLSKNKCAIKYNGRFIGICSNNVSAMQTSESCFLLEFIPENPQYFPIAFYARDICATFRTDMAIMTLYDGFLIIPSFSKKPYSRFETLFRKDFEAENTAARVTLLR